MIARSFPDSLYACGDHFEEPIVEDRPLNTPAHSEYIWKVFMACGGHVEEPIVETRPLNTSSFGIPLGGFHGMWGSF